MESSLKALSQYRFETAVSDLKAAKLLYSSKEYRASVNRSYYAIFHALRAVLALDGFDSKKHSGIIAFFNANYVKNGIFDKGILKGYKHSLYASRKVRLSGFLHCFTRGSGFSDRKSGMAY